MSETAGPGKERLALARSFLQEAVYRSRGDQAGAALFAASGPGGEGCGLGKGPSVVLDLTPRAETLFSDLGATATTPLEPVQECMAGWVRRQDGLDRKRNHFLKAFRGEHGADRRSYSEKTLGAFEEGLEAVNAQVTAALDEAAETLLLLV
jgi:hypothetical protein